MSRKTIAWSSSWTRVDGISPAMILQKMHASIASPYVNLFLFEIPNGFDKAADLIGVLNPFLQFDAAHHVDTPWVHTGNGFSHIFNCQPAGQHQTEAASHDERDGPISHFARSAHLPWMEGIHKKVGDRLVGGKRVSVRGNRAFRVT